MPTAQSTTNWIVPVGTDVVQVINVEVLANSIANTDVQTVESRLGQPTPPNARAQYDPNLEDSATDQITMAVNQVRAAIQLCSKIPLSITPGAVPPESFRHVLYLAAFGLVNSTPNLQMVILSDKGAYSPLADNFKKADAYLKAITDGKPVVPPTDPTGRDYATAVNIPWFGDASCNPYPVYDPTKKINPPIQSVRFGASSVPVDLTTWGSSWERPAPPGWPSGNLGLP